MKNSKIMPTVTIIIIGNSKTTVYVDDMNASIGLHNYSEFSLEAIARKQDDPAMHKIL